MTDQRQVAERAAVRTPEHLSLRRRIGRSYESSRRRFFATLLMGAALLLMLLFFLELAFPVAGMWIGAAVFGISGGPLLLGSLALHRSWRRVLIALPGLVLLGVIYAYLAMSY